MDESEAREARQKQAGQRNTLHSVRKEPNLQANNPLMAPDRKPGNI